jgi:hypothetical protein
MKRGFELVIWLLVRMWVCLLQVEWFLKVEDYERACVTKLAAGTRVHVPCYKWWQRLSAISLSCKALAIGATVVAISLL